MRKIAFMTSELALAEPVPLTLANFTTKSFTRLALAIRPGMRRPPHRWRAECGWSTSACPRPRSGSVPRTNRMHTDVLVLDHDPRRLRQRCRDIQRLRVIGGRRGQAAAQNVLRAVLRDGEAIDRADVDAGIALDAQLRREHRLDVAIQAALNLESRLFGRKPKFHFDVDLLEAFDESHVRHQTPLDAVVLVLVRPLVHAHFAARPAPSPPPPPPLPLVLLKLLNPN